MKKNVVNWWEKMKETFKVIDLFSGAGGLSLGFEQAGFEIIGGIDFDKSAIETFNFNFFKARALHLDLLDVDNEYILNRLKDYLEADIIIGGPPCQGFSNANRYKNEEDDERNRLFFEFVKFVDIIQPKVIVIENVRGIITSNNGRARKRIYEIFENRGYKVNHKVLNASDFGVPQNRLRNFFVIMKENLFDFESMKKSKGTSVSDAISELYEFENNVNEDGEYEIKTKPQTSYQKYLRSKDNSIKNHIIKYPINRVQERIAYVPQGGNWKDVPTHLWPNQRNNRHSSAYRRLNEDALSVTIDTGNSHSNYFHPIFNRIPTVREAARIQSFPDTFIFKGSRTDQYRQVGNAVPPLLSKSIAEAIMEVLNEK